MKPIKKTKVKKFEVVKVPLCVEYVRPILGRIYILFNLHKMVKISKIRFTIKGEDVCKPVYRLYIPKFEVKKHEES